MVTASEMLLETTKKDLEAVRVRIRELESNLAVYRIRHLDLSVELGRYIQLY